MASGSGGTTEYLEYSGKKGHGGLDESDDMKVLELLTDPEDSEVCLRYDARKKEGQHDFRYVQHKREN